MIFFGRMSRIWRGKLLLHSTMLQKKSIGRGVYNFRTVGACRRDFFGRERGGFCAKGDIYCSLLKHSVNEERRHVVERGKGSSGGGVFFA